MKKNIVLALVAIFVATATTVQAQVTTASDSIKALQAENAALRSSLAATTAAGNANSKGCFHLHLDTLNRVIKGVESCNGFYIGVGAGVDFQSYKVAMEESNGSTSAAVASLKAGYRQFWFRPEVYATVGLGNETMEERDYTLMRFGARVNVDFLRFTRVAHHHCPVDPYLFAGVNYTVVKSKKDTGVGTIPYDGNQFRAEAGLGAMVKLGTFNNGRTTTTVAGKQVSLKKKSELFLDINCPVSYGTLSKPRLAGEEQPTMKNVSITPTISVIAKF